MSKEVIIVCGPTATGKTKKALELAKELDGELISADSRQVYKYIPIASNIGNINPNIQLPISKLDPKRITTNPLLESVPIHLVQYLEPWEQMNVYEWREKAYETIEDILNRGKQPIIVGGTGLYIDSLVNSYQWAPDSSDDVDWEERRKLETLNVEELQKKLDSQVLNSLNDSDKQNKRRLIRLLEKQEIGNKTYDLRFTKQKTNLSLVQHPYTFKLFYPHYDWEELKHRIEKRVDEMFAEGLVKEVKDLIAYCNSESVSLRFSKTDIDFPIFKVMGVSQVVEFLEGKIIMKECRERIIIAHRQYARRQRTWFERGKRRYEFEYF